MSLRPIPIATLARRTLSEGRRLADGSGERILELPGRLIHRGPDGLEWSVHSHGQRAANPVGPAAGPHTQLAQNLVVGWLAGCRIFEFKTVQVRDDLAIPRPCIDMATVGFNVEWSQELRLHESAREYVKGALLMAMLHAAGDLELPADAGDVVFDCSVGYDLAGVRSDKLRGFFDTMADCRAVADELRRELPAEFGTLREVPLPRALSRSVTVSTFHGCPPGDIEAIARFLLQDVGMAVTLKLNPTLLGKRRALELLHDQLGYAELRVPDDAFAADPGWAEIDDLVGRLRQVAAGVGHGFGVKFCNTLVVENHKDFFAPDQTRMYLSGAPLHVLAMELVAKARAAWGGDLPLSFSGGLDRKNLPDAVALGLVPATVCSDLLQPGGYGRVHGYLADLGARMRSVGASALDEFAIKAYGNAERALQAAGLASPLAEQTLRQRLDSGGDLREVVGSHEAMARWVQSALVCNAQFYAERAARDPRYAAQRNRKPPRKLERPLQLFDCTNCDKCLAVCPNTAVFGYAAPDGRHQIAVYADACNDCGNCEVFCPDQGAPNRDKPRVYADLASFEAAAPRDGVWLAPDGSDGRLRRDGRTVALGDPDADPLRAIAAGLGHADASTYLSATRGPGANS